MTRIWLAIAGLGGLASVIAGAFAAHLLSASREVDLLRTGGYYGMVHAAALVAVIALAQGREPRRGAAAVAGWSFSVGIILFSFGLFAFALSGRAWIAWLAPFGGAAFMLGWLALAILATRRR
jgi:uncharacterized membrane protein YgdD (TMEM256/DUF423 family)